MELLEAGATKAPTWPLRAMGLGLISTAMASPDFDVNYVAHLARLGLTPEEEQTIGAQLGQVLGYIEKLKQVDVSAVEPTAHAVPMVNRGYCC